MMKISLPKLHFLVNVIYDLLLIEERVLIVYNYPETLARCTELEDTLSRKLVNYHPRLTSPFQLMSTPVDSTVDETLRLLDWHQKGILFVDYDSYQNLKRRRTLNTENIPGAQIHLFKTGRITVFGPLAPTKTVNHR